MRKMGIGLLVLLLLASAGILSGCCCPTFTWRIPAPRIQIPGAIRGSGNLATAEYNLDGFAGIEASSSFQVNLTQSPDFRVSVTADDNIMDYLDVRVRGNTLVLGLESGRSYNNVHLSAEIALPTLERVELSGAARAMLEGTFESDSFSAGLSGASTLSGNMTARAIELGGSGSSRFELAGSAEELTIRASGACRFDLEDLSVGDARISMSGASRCTVEVNGRLDADLSGASNVFYLGDPELGNINTSGGSNVRPRE